MLLLLVRKYSVPWAEHQRQDAQRKASVRRQQTTTAAPHGPAKLRQPHIGTRPPTGENSALLKGVLSAAAADKSYLTAPLALTSHLDEKATPQL